jgi:hypothetical protein
MFSFTIPRHSFFLWLAIRGGLYMGDRLLSWGIVEDMKCLFCHHTIESMEHLFFECDWSKKLWREVMLKSLVGPIWLDWDEVMREGMKAWKGKNLQCTTCKLALGATVYHIWKHQNSIKFCNRVNFEEQILQLICWEISTVIMEKGKGKFKHTVENVKICENWSITLSILVQNE